VLCRELCKNGCTDRDAVWVVDSGGLMEACVSWLQIGTTWQIPLNHICAAVMQSYVKLLWPLITKPHHSTTYVDVAYCYRPSRVVCRSVCLSVTLVSPAKMAPTIDMPFGFRTRVGPRNHALPRISSIKSNSLIVCRHRPSQGVQRTPKLV